MRSRAMTTYRMTLIVAALAAVAVTAVVGMATRSWIGKPFPGFFVLSNRVIPSVGRLEWAGNKDGALYQRVVVAVDEASTRDSVDVYRSVARRPAGAPIAYTLRHGSTSEAVTVESRLFSAADYWIIFGSYLGTGLLYLLMGLLGAWMVSDPNLSRAILLLGGTGGIYALSGAGIYEPGADLHLHAAAEAFFPATLIYLATACARRSERYVQPLVTSAAWLSCALAVGYELVLNQPGAYSLVHAACETYLGVAGVAAGAMLIVERSRVAQEVGPLLTSTLAGTLLGLGMPAVIMVLSGLGGGCIPVNGCTVTAFMFPLCVGWGIVRERLAWRGELVAQIA